MARVRVGRRDDAWDLAPRLRRPDFLEIHYGLGLPAEAGLARAFDWPGRKKIYSIELDGRIVGMFGVNSTRSQPDSVGAPWLLGTEALFQCCWRQFVRESRFWILELGAGFDRLENLVLAENELHVKWLQRMGFDLIEFVPRAGVHQRPYWRFAMSLTRDRRRRRRGPRR